MYIIKNKTSKYQCFILYEKSNTYKKVLIMLSQTSVGAWIGVIMSMSTAIPNSRLHKVKCTLQLRLDKYDDIRTCVELFCLRDYINLSLQNVLISCMRSLLQCHSSDVSRLTLVSKRLRFANIFFNIVFYR